VQESDQVILMTSQGKMVRLNVAEVGIVGRVAQGVRLMRVAKNEKIMSMGKVPFSDEEEGDPADIGATKE
jgi:DNA gyrase subunit A